MFDDRDVKKALVTVTIERALLDFGKPAFEKVLKVLDKEYHCYLPDCYDHPEYLEKILKQLYGNASKVIIESITKQLEEFNYQKPIEKFLQVICS
jgi:hypothetical protein